MGTVDQLVVGGETDPLQEPVFADGVHQGCDRLFVDSSPLTDRGSVDSFNRNILRARFV